MHFSVICAEDLPGGNAPPQSEDFGQGLAPLYREVCAFWPRGEVDSALQAGAAGRRADTAAVRWHRPGHAASSCRTGGRALGAKARHEVVPNAGHGLLALPCVRDAVFRFVDAADDADALRVDADCARGIPRPPVFVPPGSGAAP